MKIKLTIPEPCHENWNNMTPTEKGKHCAVCDKEVFDMTGKSEKEVAEKIRTMESGKVCARIPNEYLDKKIELHAAGIGHYGKLGAVGALLTAVAFTPMISDSNDNNSAIADKNTWQLSNQPIQINGTIVNEKGEIIPGVRITVNQNNYNAFTSSLANGRFIFKLDPQKINHGKATIKLEKEGFFALEKEILIEGNKVNEKFILKEKIELKKMQINQIDFLSHELKPYYEAKLVSMKEEIKTITTTHYEITGGAVVYTEYIKEIEPSEVKLSEPEQIEILDVETNIQNVLKTYPNPTVDFFQIEMKKEGIYTVFVFAMDGKMILNENLQSNKMTIDLSAYERGNYIVKVVDTETHESFESKVVLMK